VVNFKVRSIPSIIHKILINYNSPWGKFFLFLSFDLISIIFSIIDWNFLYFNIWGEGISTLLFHWINYLSYKTLDNRLELGLGLMDFFYLH